MADTMQARREIPLMLRRGLRRADAALYVGFSPSKFDQMVAERRLPPGHRIDGVVIWDRLELDAAFDDLMETGNAWDGK